MAAVIGARGLLRRVVIGGAQRLAGQEARDADRHDRAFRPARHHHIGVVQRDHPGRIADGVGAGGAGGDRSMVRPLQAVADRNLTAGQIDQGAGDEEGADAAHALFLQDDGRLGDGAQAADAGADHHAGAFLILVRLGLPVRIGQGLVRRRNGVQDEVVDALPVLHGHDLFGVEVAFAAPAASIDARNLTGDGAAIARGVERRDRTDARASLDDTLPALLDAPTQGGQQTDARNDDAAHGACSLISSPTFQNHRGFPRVRNSKGRRASPLGAPGGPVNRQPVRPMSATEISRPTFRR